MELNEMVRHTTLRYILLLERAKSKYFSDLGDAINSPKFDGIPECVFCSNFKCNNCPYGDRFGICSGNSAWQRLFVFVRRMCKNPTKRNKELVHRCLNTMILKTMKWSEELCVES